MAEEPPRVLTDSMHRRCAVPVAVAGVMGIGVHTSRFNIRLYQTRLTSTQTSPRRAAIRFFCDAPPHECVQNVSAYAPEARATSTSSLDVVEVSAAFDGPERKDFIATAIQSALSSILVSVGKLDDLFIVQKLIESHQELKTKIRILLDIDQRDIWSVAYVRGHDIPIARE